MNGSTSPSAVTPPADRRPRVWPGVIIVAAYWAILKGPGWITANEWAEISPDKMFGLMMLGSFGSAVLFFVWWLFFSRVAWWERLIGLLACNAIGADAYFLFHPKLKGTQFFDAMFAIVFHVLPVVTAGWVLWLLLARTLSRQVRITGLLFVLVLTWGYFTIVRLDGVSGSFSPEWTFRWQPTPEQKFLSAGESKPAAEVAAKPLELQPGDWPGFRGPNRDGKRPGVRIATDWTKNPPKELWRHLVGPGWSSFAVIGNRAYTQEQRGAEEVVVCYDANTGAEVWVHRDATRFDEAMGGAGPRATPTFHEGRIYAQGANGELNCLDAVSGKKLWSHNVATDSKAKVPQWAYSASPLVVQGIVTVFAGGPEGKGVLGYHADSGALAWAAGDVTNSYCSMQPATIDGVEQLVISSREGLTGFEPRTGKVLWRYDWTVDEMYNRVTQPAAVSPSDLLIGTGFGQGTRRVHVAREGDNWKASEVSATHAIAPYYNDFVIHKDHIYGFHNNPFFVCVGLADGKLKWKERGYDSGQVLLLPDQDLLVIQAEKGDVALVEASPERRKELARIPALKAKTWNHPVIANGKLFVRNGEEAACYQLTEQSAGGAAAK
ncbi:MAG TPA: PQQ-binding-like beta-propeller repeat protein [Gemmataceae bacterium]|nr:PQQ-binding-like beta-propeller repeat protein [Gemmataceae bacterium]